jgi:hypothetical protein
MRQSRAAVRRRSSGSRHQRSVQSCPSVAAAITRPSTASAAAASRYLPEMPNVFMSSASARWVLDEGVADRQVVEVPLQERPDGIIRRADDRLLVHVEARC